MWEFKAQARSSGYDMVHHLVNYTISERSLLKVQLLAEQTQQAGRGLSFRGAQGSGHIITNVHPNF